MTQEEFQDRLASLRARDACKVDYPTFEKIFHRVADDESALARCRILAKTYGCAVVDDRANKLFRFIRVA